MKFSKPTFVDPPKTLVGDSGDPRCPDSSKKCFKDVDDLLFGRTHLLRSDDVVFGYQGAYGLFTSKDSTLTHSSDKLFSLNDGTTRYTPPAVVGARLFNTGSDVAVTLYNQSIPPFYLQQRFADAGIGPAHKDDIRRLYYLTSHLDTEPPPGALLYNGAAK